MKVHYIYHSGFAIETETLIIIIDYYKDSEFSTTGRGIVYNQLLKKKKKKYVLATHAHHDHFNPEILKWGKLDHQITYIFSQDILQDDKTLKSQAVFLNKGDSYKDDHLIVEAFGSTDQGISMLIHLNNKLIFHAGDLNNWHWCDESTQQESKEAELWFLRELEDIYDKYKAIDLVFFPIDQRLQTDYYKGAKQFIEKIQTHYLLPMHFDENYLAANAFSPIAEKQNTRFLEITQKGQTFNINL